MKTFSSSTKSYLVILLTVLIASANAQNEPEPEKFGKVLNLGLNLPNGKYLLMPTINYEFDIAKNITLAPVVEVYSVRDRLFHSENESGAAFVFAAKGCYYFDQLFHAGPKWDFYAGVSAGFAYESVTDKEDNSTEQSIKRVNPKAHVGAQLNIKPNMGLFLDISRRIPHPSLRDSFDAGQVTAGLAFRF